MGCEAQRLHEALNAANPDPGRLTRAEGELREWPNLRADLGAEDTVPIAFVIAKCTAPASGFKPLRGAATLTPPARANAFSRRAGHQP